MSSPIIERFSNAGVLAKMKASETD